MQHQQQQHGSAVPRITMTRSYDDSSASSSCSDDSDDACFDSKCDSPFHDSGRRLIDQVVNCSLDQVYQLLFTPSKFFVDTLRSQSISGISVGTWMPPNAHGERTRTTHFTVPVTGPGFTKIAATQYLRILSCSNPRHFYAVDAKMTNAGIPYSDSFYVQIHYCVEKAGPNSTRLIVTADLKYVKSVWRFVKRFIEDICWSSMEKFYKALADQVLRVNEMTDEQRCAMTAVSEHHRPDAQEEETVRQLYLQEAAAGPGLLMDRRKSLSSSALDKMLARTGELATARGRDSSPDFNSLAGGTNNNNADNSPVRHNNEASRASGCCLSMLPPAGTATAPTPPPRRSRNGGSANSTPNAKVTKDVRRVMGLTPFAKTLLLGRSSDANMSNNNNRSRTGGGGGSAAVSHESPTTRAPAAAVDKEHVVVKLVNGLLAGAATVVGNVRAVGPRVWLLVLSLVAVTAGFGYQASVLHSRLSDIESRTSSFLVISDVVLDRPSPVLLQHCHLTGSCPGTAGTDADAAAAATRGAVDRGLDPSSPTPAPADQQPHHNPEYQSPPAIAGPPSPTRVIDQHHPRRHHHHESASAVDPIQVQRWTGYLQAAKAHLNAAEMALQSLKAELSVAESQVLSVSEIFFAKKNST